MCEKLTQRFDLQGLRQVTSGKGLRGWWCRAVFPSTFLLRSPFWIEAYFRDPLYGHVILADLNLKFKENVKTFSNSNQVDKYCYYAIMISIWVLNW